MAKLILHVGLGKTGTTAFQDAIRESSEPLKEAGYLCAGPRLKFAVPKDEELEAQYLAGEAEHLAKALRSLEKVAANSPDISTIVWSNETMGMAPDLPAVVDVIAQFIDETSVFEALEVAICFRRQDEWAESAYRQWSLKHKMMQPRGIESPEAWLERSWQSMDYLGQYQAWAKLGADRIRVMTYDEMREAGGSVPFLCTAFGLPVDLITEDIHGKKHVSLGPAQSYLNALFNSSYDGPVRPIEFAGVFEACELPELDEKGSCFLSAELRQTILDRCQPDNDALAKQVFGREHLFSDAPVGGQVLYANGQSDTMLYLCRIVGIQQQILDRQQQTVARQQQILDRQTVELNEKKHQVNRLTGRLNHEAEHLASVAARLRDMEKPGYLYRKIKRRLKAKFGRET
ncbi:hypothetical protein [Aliiroseovarius sp. F20344]|uniref:hypothetical protein n=1 Tax=Aliiroseovarius sp. F20344 TaxID=2926414 RepID=UPI001FF3141A|nr:hypothetical protein [Aliiroseovarius sp. F20344]MCK0141037.1 hypothetical protein [Aliiroseovarius sp. F20344]